MTAQKGCFEINEIDNLIDNLEMVAHFLEISTPYKWKWVMIGLHQALYGALISALQGSDSRQTVVDRQKDAGRAVMLRVHKVPIAVIASAFGKTEETILDWINNPYLISFDEALDRVKKKEYLPLVTTTEEDKAIHRLTKEFRNEFEHFRPKRWIVPTSIFPHIARNVLRVINFLAFESNCVCVTPEEEQRIRTVVTKIEYLLGQ
jgi:hypothetical protein